MKRRAFLAGSLAAAFTVRKASAIGRKNVVFLLADSQRFDTIHELGNGTIRTPNLDHLVKTGFSFTNCFACDPWNWGSRASLLTGCNNIHAGVRRGDRTINVQWPLWPEIMQAVGYNTFFTGRWLDTVEPRNRGFKTVRFPVRTEDGPHELSFATETGKTSGFSSNLFTDAAVEFIRSKPEPPFFLYVSYMAPHRPWTPPGEYAKMYRPDKISLPKNFMEQPALDSAILGAGGQGTPAKALKPDFVRGETALYYGMISQLDEQIGRILNELKKAKLEEDAIVIFASDCGVPIGSHGLFERESLYDECLRVPLVIRARERALAGFRSPSLCQLQDLVPTVCDLVGMPAPNGINGLSLTPMLTKPSVELRDEVFAGFGESQQMVRTREWKLIDYSKANKKQLFHIDSDPEEMKDLSGGDANKKTIELLMSKLGDHRKQLSGALVGRASRV